MWGDTRSSGTSMRCSTKKENTCRFCRSKTTVLWGCAPISASEAACLSSPVTRHEARIVTAAMVQMSTELSSTPTIRSRRLTQPCRATRVPHKLLVDQ